MAFTLVMTDGRRMSGYKPLFLYEGVYRFDDPYIKGRGALTENEFSCKSLKLLQNANFLSTYSCKCL
jgi:hypothetical protein